ncbi:MAG: zinc-ribbon domain-containing protein [Candidatus Helarchaeota archaeon]|nr:zinc-ribbon domain-containing protein [Candidatus Helarchaeota archaeon]
MSVLNIFNIIPPEEVKFDFTGKLGRITLTWRKGRWIITNKRLIFVSDRMFFDSREYFWSHFRRPLALIIPLPEVKEVINKKTKIIVRYLARTIKKFDFGVKKLGIGFLQEHFKIYGNYKHSDLLEAVYRYLKNPRDVVFEVTCPKCNAKLQKDERYCPSCGVSFNICEICKHPLLDDDVKQIRCPYCQARFHREEFLEWVKVHGRCPTCDFGISQDELKQAEKVIGKYPKYLY